jgi:hypothetical protein
MKLGNVEKLYTVVKDFQDTEMPLKIAYKFSQLLNASEDNYQFFIEKMRQILNKYAVKDENGQIVNNEGTIPIQPEFLERAEQEVKELHNIEVDMPKVRFTLEELESVSFKPSALRALIDFIEQ